MNDVAEYITERLAPIERSLADLRAENIELRGLIGDLLTAFNKSSAAAVGAINELEKRHEILTASLEAKARALFANAEAAIAMASGETPPLH
jgi:hypothetical protein